MTMVSEAPGVLTREIDLTGSITAAGTNSSSTVGDYNWGPVEVRTQISDRTELELTFGKPTDRNYVDWFVASSYLAYSSSLYVVRVIGENALNSTASGTGLLIKNEQMFNMLNDGTSNDDKMFVAKYPGVRGNSLEISIADVNNYDKWEYADEFDSAPGTSEYAEKLGATDDEVHLVVVDKLGLFTGVPGTILERYAFLSKSSDAKALDGSPMYYGNVINKSSQYIWFFGNPDTDKYDDQPEKTTAWGTPLVVNGVASKYKVLKDTKVLEKNPGLVYTLAGGNDGEIPSTKEIISGWDLFKSTEEIDVGILISGQAGGEAGHTRVVQNIIDNIAEIRKDCVVCYSPKFSDVMNKTQSQAVDAILKTRQNVGRSSSYAIMDSGWKLVYDVYNDKNRWIPLNGDIAGLLATTERDYDAWWSPAGFNRGKLKNVIQLAFNPNSDSRKALYKKQINSVVTFTTDGTILYGDKTQQAKTSAFQYINVRRLFITLQKSISQAAKYSLFEFNDDFTRSQFKSMVRPYLNEVKGRRGVYDFLVVCDESNNPPEVVDAGRFVGAIYIKPTRSINHITLDFVATRTGVEFSEVVGKY